VILLLVGFSIAIHNSFVLLLHTEVNIKPFRITMENNVRSHTLKKNQSFKFSSTNVLNKTIFSSWLQGDGHMIWTSFKTLLNRDVRKGDL